MAVGGVPEQCWEARPWHVYCSCGTGSWPLLSLLTGAGDVLRALCPAFLSSALRRPALRRPHPDVGGYAHEFCESKMLRR